MKDNDVMEIGNKLGTIELEKNGYHIIEKIKNKKVYYLCQKDNENIIVKIISRQKYGDKGNENLHYNIAFDDKDLDSFKINYNVNKIFILTNVIDNNVYSSYFNPYNNEKTIDITKYNNGQSFKTFAKDKEFKNPFIKQ